MIHAKGKLSFEEYLECWKFVSKKSLFINNAITFACGVFLFCLEWYYDFKAYTVIILPLSFAYLSYALILYKFRFRYKLKKNWEKYPKIQEEITMDFLEDGMQVYDVKNNPNFLPWSDFMDFKETTNLFLILISPKFPICVPKRFLKEDDKPKFRKLCEENIKKV